MFLWSYLTFSTVLVTANHVYEDGRILRGYNVDGLERYWGVPFAKPHVDELRSDNSADPPGIAVTVQDNKRTITGYSNVVGFDGIKSENVSSFRGIPYAEPPVNTLRFAKPVRSEELTDINAANFQANCVGASQREHESEDCLYLNIFRPISTNSNAKLPVLVFIPGGFFVQGGTNFAYYDPTPLVRKFNDIILVTIQYRLGYLGFAAGLESYNNGLRDQTMALEWIQQHISNFGGNPNRVCILGNSAGADSVLIHNTNLQFDTLFQSSYVSSFTGIQFQLMHEAIATTSKMSKIFKCEEFPTVLECMRSVPAREIVKAQIMVQAMAADLATAIPTAFSNMYMFGPVIDEEIVKGQHVDVFRQGNFLKDKHLVMGVVNNEAAYLLYMYRDILSQIAPTNDISLANYNLLTSIMFSSFSEELKAEMDAVYHCDGPACDQVLANLSNDLIFFCPMYTLSSLAAAHSRHIYAYLIDIGMVSSEWTHNEPLCVGQHLCHSDDVPSIFHSHTYQGVPENEYRNRNLQPAMQNLVEDLTSMNIPILLQGYPQQLPWAPFPENNQLQRKYVFSETESNPSDMSDLNLQCQLLEKVVQFKSHQHNHEEL